MTKIVIKTELLDAIARFAYPYQDRAISRVAFRNEQIIATDGHRIVIADFKLHGQSFAIERRHLLAAVAAQDAMERSFDSISERLGYDVEASDGGASILSGERRGGREMTITPGVSSVAFDVGSGIGIQVELASFEGYPDIAKADRGWHRGWERAQRRPDERPLYGLNPGFLADMETLVRAAGHWSAGIELTNWGRDPNADPIEFTAPHGAQPGEQLVRVVIMPMRTRDANRAKERRTGQVSNG